MTKKNSQQGIALIWLIVAGALLIVGVGAAASRKTALKTEEFPTDAAGQEFVGSIREVVAEGVPVKCTYTQGGYTGVIFISGKKGYGEIGGGGDVTAYTIFKDNCMWNWYQGDSQGTRICFAGDIWNTTETLSDETEYQCVTASFSESLFEPPGNVNFTNVGETPSEKEADLMKILPAKERTELENAINEAQNVLKNTKVFDYAPPSIDDITQGLDQINKQAQEQIQKNIEKQQQQFTPLDPQKIQEYFNQNPPTVPQEGKEFSPEEQEYYYRKYILQDPAFQW
jgi:hypothetical protein